MKVILQEDVEHVGSVGDTVSVSDGFGRNFLIPRGLALPANERNVKELAHRQRLVDHRRAQARDEALELQKRVEAITCSITKLSGETGKLFGSVTNSDIQLALSDAGVEIERRRIQLDEPIKNIGIFNVPVKLHVDVIATLKVWVVKKEVEEGAEVAAEDEDED